MKYDNIKYNFVIILILFVFLFYAVFTGRMVGISQDKSTFQTHSSVVTEQNTPRDNYLQDINKPTHTSYETINNL